MNEPTLFEEVTGIPADPAQKPRHEYRVAEGRRRRDRGIAKVNANSDGEFAAICQEAIRYLADKRSEFTADDIRDLVAIEPHSPNAWGGQINAALRAGVIVNVGYRKSERPEAHRRVVGVYEGAK